VVEKTPDLLQNNGEQQFDESSGNDEQHGCIWSIVSKLISEKAIRDVLAVTNKG
jgi:hypothetical protein